MNSWKWEKRRRNDGNVLSELAGVSRQDSEEMHIIDALSQRLIVFKAFFKQSGVSRQYSEEMDIINALYND